MPHCQQTYFTFSQIFLGKRESVSTILKLFIKRVCAKLSFFKDQMNGETDFVLKIASYSGASHAGRLAPFRLSLPYSKKYCMRRKSRHIEGCLFSFIVVYAHKGGTQLAAISDRAGPIKYQ